MSANKKILFVDDDELIIKTFKPELERSGFEVVTAIDGSQAISKAQSERPDAIVLDLMLPIMSGIEVLSKLKSDEKLKDIPVLVLTNYGTDENAKKALSLGAVDFILKYRFVPSEVVNKVREALD